MNTESLDLETIGMRLKHGLPITIEQSRWLFEQHTGEQITTRKRCKACNDEGMITVFFVGIGEILMKCKECGG